MQLDKELLVGIAQTTLDAKKAWSDMRSNPKISSAEDSRIWHEILKAMRAFKDGGKKPRMIVFPELSLPRTRLNDFERLVAALNVLAFVGVDYRTDMTSRVARNEGIVFIPRNFWQDRPSKTCARVIFGKAHPAPKEKEKLEALSPSWKFAGDHNVYVFDAEQYGKIGVSICYDFMDLERALMYRGKIHHLFVMAYNQDLNMFQSLADSLSRTVYCNVVICNTGFFGGSLAVSPYFEAFKRRIYSHAGTSLFTTQVVPLPVDGLELALRGKGAESTPIPKPVREFKHPPPGADASVSKALVAKSLQPDIE